MDQIRGVNTRLEVKNNYNELKDNFFSSRIQHAPNIKPINQEKLEDFHTFNKKETQTNTHTGAITPEEYENLTIQYKNTSDIHSNDIETPENANKNSTPTQTTHIKPAPSNKYPETTHTKPTSTQYKYPQTTHIKPAPAKNVPYINPQTYIPEIGMKRKLTNILLNVLNKRDIRVSIPLIEEYISRYNLTFTNPDPKILSQIISELKTLTHSSGGISNVEFERETLQTTHLISIDSINRDMSKYPKPNEFKIDFNPVSMGNTILKGYIGKSFENVISVQLISAIFPKNIDNGGNHIEDYPYIILEIDELGGNYQSTNDNSSNAFAQISFDIDCGKYKKLISRTDKEYKKKFHPRISIHSFTIRIKTPDGVLYHFGNIPELETKTIEDTNTDNSKPQTYDPTDIPSDKQTMTDDPYPPIHLIFKITQIQRKLDNMYLHP